MMQLANNNFLLGIDIRIYRSPKRYRATPHRRTQQRSSNGNVSLLLAFAKVWESTVDVMRCNWAVNYDDFVYYID